MTTHKSSDREGVKSRLDNGEMKRLMLSHAFKFIDQRDLWSRITRVAYVTKVSGANGYFAKSKVGFLLKNPCGAILKLIRSVGITG